MPVIPPKNKKEFSWGRFSKTLSFWILIILIPVVLIQLSGQKAEPSKQVTSPFWVNRVVVLLGTS